MIDQPPESLVRGCNDPVSIGILSDWIEEQYGMALDYQQSGWDDVIGFGYSNGNGNGHGNIFGNGNGHGHGFGDGNGRGNGYGNGYVYGYLRK